MKAIDLVKMKPFVLNVDPDATVTSHQLEHQLDSCDPLACVLFSHAPSVQMYFALRTRLESSTEDWLKEFISLDGLDSLLDSLCHMCGPQFNGFSDAILQIDCLSCIRAILNSKIGMTSLIASQNGMEKLLKGVDLANTLPRKHVFEIMSAVCVYNNCGYKRTMEAMNKYRKERHQVHKLSFIVNELKLAETIPHKTSILTFINAVISSTPDKSQRCRIRNEFTGLGLLDVVSFLQREETDEDLYVQLQVFQDKKHDDESTLNSELQIDFNCPQDLADTIQSKVFGGPKMVCFVNILQDLLAVETSNKEKSDAVWKVLERHVHHLVHATDKIESQLFIGTDTACEALTTAVETDRLLSSCSCTSSNSKLAKDRLELPGEKRKRLDRVSSTSSIKKDSCLKTSADSGFIGCEDKLSPTSCDTNNLNMENKEHFIFQDKKATNCAFKNILNNENHENLKKHQNDMGVTNILDTHLNADKFDNKIRGKHLSLYDNMNSGTELQKDTNLNADSDHLNNINLQLQFKKLTAFNSGAKLDENNVFTSDVFKNEAEGKQIGDQTSGNATEVGSNAKKSNEDETMGESNHLTSYDKVYQANEIVLPTKVMRNLKWIKLNDSFIDECPQAIWANMKSDNLKIKPDFGQVEELFQEQYDDKMAETPLLSMKTRLHLNLFLHRCEDEPTELVKKLVRVDGPSFSLPFIKHLTDIIPEPDEVKHLKFYNGNLLELGQAEQFILHLSDVPDYNIVLTGQLQKAEFRAMSSRLRMVLNSMLESSKVILSNEGVKEIFLFILKLGNFCNHGQYNGYAHGFKLSSLIRFADLKSKEPGHTFSHYLITCIEAHDANLLSFFNDIPQLEKAASHSLANIKADFDKMNSQINSFVRQLATANPIIRNGFDSFLEEVKREFRSLQGQIGQLKIQSKCLAAYFCESDCFELQACFKALLDLFQELRLCKEEVKLMKIQKTTATKHTQMFNGQIQTKNLALQFGQEAGANSSMLEEKQLLVDTLLTELHRGNFSSLSSETIPPNKKPANRRPFPQHLPLASTLASLPSIMPVMSAPCIGITTPERKAGSAMELSRISLMGTPMINRPSSEMFDEDITITNSKPFTSSENDLIDEKGLQKRKIMKKTQMPLPKPLSKTSSNQGRGHYRSRSDLTDSININTKWIRYHEQLKFEKAPLAKPESSITVATLNLEAGNSICHLYPGDEAMTLLNGPTVELPPHGNFGGELNKQGKKSERRSTISRMINKISRRVLKTKNVDVLDNVDLDENLPGDMRKMEKRQAQLVKANSLGRATGLAVIRRENDKENFYDAEIGMNGPLDRQTKNPIRLSNRFKNKFIR